MPRLSLPTLAAVLAVSAGLIGEPRLYDDAYITLRYARSIVEGQGFVFNAGERVLGTTTPLLTLTLALLHRISGVGLPQLAFTIAVAGHAATAALLTLIGRNCGFAIAGGLAAAVYAVAPLVTGPVLGGMETSIFTASVLAALMPSTVERTSQSVLAAAAALLRPEGLLVVALRITAAVRHRKTSARRAATIIALGLVPWVAFATWYFGSPIPQSMKAKWMTSAGRTPPWSVAEMFLYTTLRLPIGSRMPPAGLLPRSTFGSQIAALLPFPNSMAVRQALVLAATCLLTALIGTGAGAIYRRCRNCVWLLLFSAIYIAAYCVVQPAMFQWYFVPPLPALLLVLFAGAQCVVEGTVRQPRARQALLAALGVALMIGVAFQIRLLSKPSPAVREATYQKAVTLLGIRGQDPATTIGALEIGAIGYATHARIVDYYGLVSPQLNGRSVDKMLDNSRPDYFIVHASLARLEGVLDNRRFLESYHKIASLDASAGLVLAEIQIFQRNAP